MEDTLVNSPADNHPDPIQDFELDSDVGLREIRRSIPTLYFDLVSSEVRETYLSFYDQKSKVVLVNEDQWGIPENWFFIGDIHGDFLRYITS